MYDYRKGAHTVYDIKYHIVWLTKYRYKVLTGEIALRAREIIRQTCLALDVHIIKGHISKDHIHLFVSVPPGLSAAKLTVRLFFRFRDFFGFYPMHCHNTVHEDHAMMVRWEITPDGDKILVP